MRNMVIFFLVNLLLTSCSNQVADEKLNAQSEVLVEEFVFENSPVIGEYENFVFHEGGFSGIYYIPESGNEFYLINDRGPNIPASNNQKANNKEVKIFPFPQYSQKLAHVKLENGKIKILSITPLYAELGAPISGLPIPAQDALYQEYAWQNISGVNIPATKHGADIEGLVFQNDSIFWFAEEYRPSIWKMNMNTMQKVEVFSPDNNGLPPILNKRRPNRGFEGIAYDNHETIYAMMQSPLWNPSKNVEKQSRLTRIVTLNIKTGQTKMFMYEMNKPKSEVRIEDWKIGDIVAIEEGKFLVLEHGSRGNDFFADVYIVDVTKGAEISKELDLKFALEEFATKESLLQQTGIRVVGKTHLLNLSELGLGIDLGKLEGISLINDSTIAIINDNDYGIDPVNDSGEFKPNQILTKIIIIKNLKIK